LIVTLWSASAGVDSLRSALNAIYERKETRSWLWTKAMSIGITLLMIVFAAFVLAIVFYGWKAVQFELESLGIVITSPWVLVTIQWISIFLVLLVACEVLFNLLPNFDRFRWKWLNMGSFVSIVLWAILIGVFRLYLQYFQYIQQNLRFTRGSHCVNALALSYSPFAYDRWSDQRRTSSDA
jgi:membrane protein